MAIRVATQPTRARVGCKCYAACWQREGNRMAKDFEHVDDVCARWRWYARRGLLPVRERRRVDWRRYQRRLGKLMRAESER